MRLRLACLSRIWVCIILYSQRGDGLRNRVYMEADKNCGKEETLVPGQHLIVGSKHGGQEILKERCEITFRLAHQNSKDRICIEFEQLDFQGNCFASLSVIDVVSNDSKESLYTESPEEKQVGLYTCMWEPPLEICSVGQSLKIHLDRGYHMLDRELVVFLLEVYTKNPDASATDSPLEEQSVFGFFGDQPTPVLLLVIIVLCLVITVTATVIVICMRLKSRTSCRQIPLQPEYAHANASVLSQDANISASQMSSHEYYQLQPLPPPNCDNQHLKQAAATPTAPYISQPHPSCVYTYHRLNKDAAVTTQHRFIDHPDQITRPVFPSQRSITGYNEPISERSVSPNDPGYATEPAVRCYYGYRNPCVLHGYSGLPNNCRVLQGYHSYPGLQYMGLPRLHGNYGSRAGEEDADESDISECEGQDGVSKDRHPSYQEADYTSSEKADKVKWAQMGVL